MKAKLVIFTFMLMICSSAFAKEVCRVYANDREVECTVSGDKQKANQNSSLIEKVKTLLDLGYESIPGGGLGVLLVKP